MKIIKITDNQYPKRLLEIKNPPKTLYVEGNARLLNNNSLAVVGSRKCSEYGVKCTKEFVKAMAKCEMTIVSGLAIGIDTVAHQTAKKHKGNTIAVLGSGFNEIYPEENKKLFNEIIEEEGCIISEYEPNKKVDMKNFPKRNRIVSGIALGVLVIEASYRSGSTITARYGLEQNKKVFCIPRNIGEANGIGTNKLIQNGAMLVTSPKEILTEFNMNYLEEKTIKKVNKKIEKVKEQYRDIYNLISYVPTNIQDLKINSKLTMAEINQKLTILELEGYIKSLPGNKYVRI